MTADDNYSWQNTIMAHKCPICDVNHSSGGKPFETSWAVSCHIAGKARSGDFKHMMWVTRVAPSLHESSNPSLPDIANRIDSHVAKVLSDPSYDLTLAAPARTPEEPYHLVKWIEETVHTLIRDVIVSEYGMEDWWRKGVSVEIRKICAARREDDAKPQDIYAYIDLIDLKEILHKQWKLFHPRLRPGKRWFTDKPELMGSLVDLNELRKRIMHPARRYECDEADLALLSRFKDAFQAVVEANDPASQTNR
jgi:hypothetical protein